ncbi:hypothetical protein PUR23_07185 [Methylorubrum populi]|jgi:hypothetical protein|uniref:Uncharacterized protein n=1 Tax=Methylorubrum populi (strain ATCC BAA-705 / NCIMB 13946 / BJ001) TaxID=441620 RepID=B1ZDH4_METPB|nr:hypothetical protein [Methylorubrum populi]ACB79517.1 hypothetical protein Mpop_1347 [Methylorubrum populi BJ001]OAH36883.1 hypothetical protein AX289_29265 [Methylorubrum populi]PZP65661.1 MAG: hypothetical protein DI590_26500 [Methylorubrum populi]
MASAGTSYWSDFSLGQNVYVGDDQSITARVTGITFRDGGQEIEVAWMVNGALSRVWVPPGMLKPAPRA